MKRIFTLIFYFIWMLFLPKNSKMLFFPGSGNEIEGTLEASNDTSGGGGSTRCISGYGEEYMEDLEDL